MKQCDRNFSPFAIGSSSSLSFPASESDPEESLWHDFPFDFSFLTSEDQKISLDDDDNAESSKLYGLGTKGDFARPVRNQRFDLEVKSGEVPDFLESKPSPSLALFSTSRFDSNVTIGDEQVKHFPPTASVLGISKIANENSGDNRADCAKLKEPCSGEPVVSKDVTESDSSPLFSKISALRSSGYGIDKLNLCTANRIVLPEEACILDDTEVDSPCWRGAQPCNTAASGSKSLNLRRSSDDLNVLSQLNPLAPQFIPHSAKKNLDKNGKEYEENSSSSLKWSHDTDESLGLVSQDSVCKIVRMLDISDDIQTSKKLDPLAPVFVPASAKLSDFVHEKHGEADHMIAVETNAYSAYGLSSSDDMLPSYVEVETHSSEVDQSCINLQSNNVHEPGTTYSFNPQLESQVWITENTKMGSSSYKSHVPKKLNPLAPQFSLAGTKPKGYSSEKNQAANDFPPKVTSLVLVSPVGYRKHKEPHTGLVQSSVHVEPSYHEFDTKSQPTKEILPFHIVETAASSGSSSVQALSDFGHGVGFCCSSSSPSPKIDSKKLLTTIHGLSELLTHVGDSETSDQDLDIISRTVQNLNSYINNRVQEHTGNYASPTHSSCDSELLPNMRKRSVRDHKIPNVHNLTYSMVSEEMVDDSCFEYGVTKQNGYDKVIGKHQTKEQMFFN